LMYNRYSPISSLSNIKLLLFSEYESIQIKSPEASDPISEISTCQNKTASFIEFRKISQKIKTAFIMRRKLETKRG